MTMSTQPSKPILLRKDYMSGKVTHKDYFEQFVDEEILTLTQAVISGYDLGKKLKADKYLNNIPMRFWDAGVHLLPHSTRVKLEEAGDFLSLSTGVCILKAAARLLVKSA